MLLNKERVARFSWNDQYTEFWGKDFDFGMSGEEFDQKPLNFVRGKFKAELGESNNREPMPIKYIPAYDPQKFDSNTVNRMDTYIRQILPTTKVEGAKSE